MATTETPLKRTPLNATHHRLGAKMIDFGGWEMPVRYRGILEEHRMVRASAGLFDVSHMGEVELRGPDALAAVQRLTTNDAARLAPGRVQYSALPTEGGTFVDDVTTYRLADDRFLLTVNASNIAKDIAWIRAHAGGRRVEVTDRSDDTALLALQGPRAAEMLQPLTRLDLAGLRYYGFAEGEVAGQGALVSRTGYTGEDGFEIYLAAEGAEAVWDRLLDVGGDRICPVGLGARDTLRLEAKLALYGHDIDEEHTVLEADLGWIVKFDKGDFIGRPALARQREEGVRRKLVGFEMVGRGIARQGYPIVRGGRRIGQVTSGAPAPTLQRSIGLGYVEIEAAAVGTEFAVEIRGAPVAARVVPTPFYKRGR
jgi:aminomethyltransferase